MGNLFSAIEAKNDIHEFLLTLCAYAESPEQTLRLTTLRMRFEEHCEIVELRGEKYGHFSKVALLALWMDLRWRFHFASRTIGSNDLSDSLRDKMNEIELSHIEPMSRGIARRTKQDERPYALEGAKETIIVRLEQLQSLAQGAQERTLKRYRQHFEHSWDEIMKEKYGEYGVLPLFDLMLETNFFLAQLITEPEDSVSNRELLASGGLPPECVLNRELYDFLDLIKEQYTLPMLTYTAQGFENLVSRKTVENFAYLI